MAMSADLPGAFEVGPVFRAENSNTARHLCEFTGLDFEMPIRWHYEEVIKVIHETLSTIFHRLEEAPIYRRGDILQEIGSGAQRCHDPQLLEARCAELGVPTGPLESYIESFRHGVPPHGGVGLGLERIVQLYLGLDNIRKASMFARDPTRLTP
eukprot:g22954.t1